VAVAVVVTVLTVHQVLQAVAVLLQAVQLQAVLQHLQVKEMLVGITIQVHHIRQAVAVVVVPLVKLHQAIHNQVQVELD
jgi:hypothetical protein